MKILFIHHCNERGGGSKSLLDIINMLKDEEIILITNKGMGKGNYLGSKIKNSETIKEKIGTLSWYSGGPKIWSRTFFKDLFKIIDSKKYIEDSIIEHKPDIVVVNSIVLSWIGIIKHNKKVCFVRETRKTGILSIIQDYLLKKFVKVIFISEYDYKKFSNIEKSKKEIIFDCVKKEEFFKEKKVSRNKEFNILYVGGQSELKGWQIVKELLLKSEMFKNYNDINFIILGEISEKEKINNSKIHYLGLVDDINTVYCKSDIAILPSTKPHQLRPIFEAGISKVPIITSKFEEILEHNKEGGIRLIPANDWVALEKEIIFLYKNPKERERLRELNYKYTLERHEFQKIKEKLKKIFMEI